MEIFASLFSNFIFPWFGGIWGKIIGFFGKYGLFMVAILLLCGAMFFSGYQYRGQKDILAQTKTVPIIVQQVVDGQAKQQTVYVEDLEKVRKLEADKATLQKQLDRLKETVKLYVPEDNVGAFVSPCAVRLLNDAAAGTDTTEPKNLAATIAACRDTGPGTLTWQRFVQHEIELRGKYNVARDQGNALIEWVEKNVVNPPNQPSKTDPEK